MKSFPTTPKNYFDFTYSPFHKTLPKSGLKMHWISIKYVLFGQQIQKKSCAQNTFGYYYLD